MFHSFKLISLSYRFFNSFFSHLILRYFADKIIQLNLNPYQLIKMLKGKQDN